MRRTRAAGLSVVSYRVFCARVRSRISIPESPRPIALAAVAAFLILVPQGCREAKEGRPAPGPDVREHGAPAVDFYYERQGQAPAKVGDASLQFQPGDKIQFAYDAAGYRFVTLASIDSRGKPSLYRQVPDSRSASLETGEGELQALPFSITLDASPGGELFCLAFSRGPLADSVPVGRLTKAYSTADHDLGKLETTPIWPAGDGGALRCILIRKGFP
jgi:hypothetical protein